jgi:hypothetical protein
MVYGFTSECIYRLDLESLAIEVVVRPENGISVAGPIMEGKIYFASGHRLRSAQIF